MTSFYCHLSRSAGSAKAMLIFIVCVLVVPTYLFIEGVPKPLLIHLGRPVGKIQSRGFVQRRHPLTPGFIKVKSGDPIYMGDVIYTSPKGEAVVLFQNGMIAEFSASSMAKVSSVSGGSVDLILYLGRVAKANSQEFPELRVSEERGLDAPLFDLLKYVSASKYAVAVANAPPAGTVYDRVVGRERAVPKRNITATIPRAPRLRTNLNFTYPKRSKNRIRRNERHNLRWNQVMRGITYVVEVSPNKNFKKKIVERTKRLQTTLRLHKPGTYYVRVRTVVRGRWISSSAKMFTVVR